MLARRARVALPEGSVVTWTACAIVTQSIRRLVAEHRRKAEPDRLIKSVGCLEKNAVAVDGVGLKLLETVDGVGVEMPPAPADTQAEGVRQLVGRNGLELEPIAAAGRRVDTEGEVVVIDGLLGERADISGIGGEPYMLAQHQVCGRADPQQVPVVRFVDDGNEGWIVNGGWQMG